MVGIPGFSGFISKLLFSTACIQNTPYKMLPTLICLGISTILNAIYFMKTVIRIYTPVKSPYDNISVKKSFRYVGALICFVILNIVLGMCSTPIVSMIQMGLKMFS